MLGPDIANAVRAVRSHMRWAVKTTPGDHAVALSVALASAPVVGRHLEMIGSFAALGVGGRHYVPGIVAGMTRRRFSPDGAARRRARRAWTPNILTTALDGIVAQEHLAQPWPSHRNRAPLWNAAGQRRYVYRSSVRYGGHPRQLLDVWRDERALRNPAPVLIFIPGGAWVFGRREVQGHALMAHLARRGWVCMSVQYRTSPHHRWPRQMIDVKTAIGWARANAQRFGGDPDFVVVAGCSAGGHLATLAGLTTNDPQWHAELPADANTSVDGIVSVYGTYDWEDRSTGARDHYMRFLERVVVKRSQASDPDVYRAASPMQHVHSCAPPFLAIHGSDDGIIPVAEARAFVESMRSSSEAPVGYIELPGVGHGFDLVDGTRTAAVVAAIARFLDQIHRDRPERKATSVG